MADSDAPLAAAAANPAEGMLAGIHDPKQNQARPTLSVEGLPQAGVGPGLGGDKYALVEESGFLSVQDAPLSTFSIDVDTASYAKTRAYLLEHHALPPPDAIRIEELINYFEYSYAEPTDGHPFAVHIETAECPWRPQHRLVRFGIQGKRIDRERPVSNLVFLIDVSGSMDAPNKLPLVQRGLSMLVRQLGENDRVAVVVYAGAAGLVLPPTSGSDQATILQAIQKLRAGGSTNGGQGIHLAYNIARDHLVQDGVNRVILCTDGDFNVGTTSTADLVRLAQDKAKGGVYLSILGFGFGNHNDAMLEELSNKANGNYAFIDSDREAHKVLVEQMQGTLVTIAKDVKLQVEFNPAQVAAYRLIGYENRRLADRDFNDDTKDAGDIGAGHSVTALYEIVPMGIASEFGRSEVDSLKYQGSSNFGSTAGRPKLEAADADIADELLTLKLRYQPPAGGASTLLSYPVKDSGVRIGSASTDFQFAAAVASFGMLLRNSKYRGDVSYAAVLEAASATRGADKRGSRSEFVELVRAAQRLSSGEVGVTRAGRFAPATPAISPSTERVFPRLVQGQRAEHEFAMGLVAGGLIVVATLAFCSILLALRSRLLEAKACATSLKTSLGPGCHKFK